MGGTALQLGLCVVALAALANARLDFSTGARPRLDLVSPAEGYHGVVREDNERVEVTPAIRAVGAPVCGFRIVNKYHGDAPFEVITTDDSTGEAIIQARRPLNCEKRKSYRFDVAAVGCGVDAPLSDNVTVHITVEDVNEYAPRFTERSYILDVDEGRLYDEVVTVTAEDQDCSPKYGDICQYEILTSDQPFVINSQGTIRNTEPLSYEKSHNHILFIVAYDCGGKRSDEVTVTIKVNRVCHLGWKDLPEHVEYAPSSGSVSLFPDATLDMCEVPCAVERVQSKISLQTLHIGKGCDRDTFSVESQRRMCGADTRAVDLLPSPLDADSQWTRPLPRDHGHEADEVFQFDGISTAVEVPASVMSHDLGKTFTISVWLRHADHPNQDKHVKEHVLCNADDHRMSRHHYALFIRNCHLILLLRKEYDQANLNTFAPAEWRWELPQVCDDEWHHYALSMEYPNLSLFVDGRAYHSEPQMHEVIDDWPLHSTPDLTTKLAVGGCWQGGESRMKHIFSGYMAGLSVLRGATEKEEVLQCLHECSESLQAPDVQFLQPGMELLANNDMTEVTVEGNNRTHIESLFRKIGYMNTRQFPTPGRRGLKVITNLVCSSGKSVKIPVVDSYVLVRQPRYLHISVNGTDNFSDNYEQLKTGVSVFPDVRVQAGTDQYQPEADSRFSDRTLDKCTVSVYPPLNPEHEQLSLQQRLLDGVELRSKLSKDGIVVYGPGQPYKFQKAMRSIQYTNLKPAYYLNRAFKLLCSSMSMRFISNEYVQTLTVIHPSRPIETPKQEATEAPPALPADNDDDAAVRAEQEVPAAAAHVQDARHHVELKSWSTGHRLHSAGASHAVTIIIVVCISFLVSMIVLGVIRIRAAHRRHQEETADAEMAWDDSGLNITVNPMEQDAMGTAAGVASGAVDDDSSDDGSDYDSSGDDDDDAAPAPGARKQLEWDNSLSI